MTFRNSVGISPGPLGSPPESTGVGNPELGDRGKESGMVRKWKAWRWRQSHRPFDWAEQCPDLRSPLNHVRHIEPDRPKVSP